jgi:hypothetical protein
LLIIDGEIFYTKGADHWYLIRFVGFNVLSDSPTAKKYYILLDTIKSAVRVIVRFVHGVSQSQWEVYVYDFNLLFRLTKQKILIFIYQMYFDTL